VGLLGGGLCRRGNRLVLSSSRGKERGEEEGMVSMKKKRASLGHSIFVRKGGKKGIVPFFTREREKGEPGIVPVGEKKKKKRNMPISLQKREKKLNRKG